MCPKAPEQQQRQQQPSVLIIGGGPAGLAMAAHLLTAGWQCRILERRSRESLLADTNSFYDMAASGIQALLRIANGAAAPAVFREAVAYDKIALYMGKKKSTPLTNLENKSRGLGMPMFNITRAALLTALVETVENLDPNCIQYETTAKLIDHELGTVEVETVMTAASSSSSSSTKETIQADLVVGADGIHSRVRKHIFGDTGMRSDGIVACYAVLPPLSKEQWDTFPKPPGVGDAFGTLGLSADFAQYSVVNDKATIWYANFMLDDKKPYIGLPPTPKGGWLGEAKRRCEGGIPAMEALIARTKEEDMQVVMCCDRLPLDTYSSGRVVLVGDAAHPFTPFAGLGSSQAMVDAFCLAEALLSVQSGSNNNNNNNNNDPIKGAIATFEKQRVKAANDQMNESRDLCGTDLGSRLRWGLFEFLFIWAARFGKADELADNLMTFDRPSMVNKLVPFKSKEEEEAYEKLYQEAKTSLQAKLK